MKKRVRVIKSDFSGIQKLVCRKKFLRASSTLHFHEFYELELILDGDGITVINGREYAVKRGMAVLLSPNDFHEYKTEDGILMYNVQLGSDEVSGIALHLPEAVVCMLCEEETKRLADTLALIDDKADGGTEDIRYREKILDAAIIFVTSRIRANESKSIYPAAIEKALSYIHFHFKENPSLDEISGMVFLDKRYFCTLFSRYVGKTYKTYLRDCKLTYAARLLLCTELSVTDVSMECGYATVSHFNREFANFYKTSPTNMRKEFCRW